MHGAWWWVQTTARIEVAMIRRLACLLWLLPTAASLAQELEPRSYTNIPIGETFLVLGASRSDGDLSPNPSSPLQDAALTIDTGIVGLAHTFAIGDDSAKVDLAIARSCYEGSAVFRGEFIEGRRCEYADPRIRVGWNFYGAPAMQLKDFATWEPGLVIGASLQASVPVGDYTSRQLINAGLGRWVLRPGVGLSFRTGRWHYDLSASVKFFEDNDDFFEGRYLEQDPLIGGQFHIVRYFNRGRWLSLNGNFYRGGETTVDGISANDRQENSRWGATFSTPLTAHQSLKIYANTGVVTRIGGDFDTFGLAWQYRF